MRSFVPLTPCVHIALPIPRSPLYTYTVGLHAGVVPGQRVLVPVGKRIITGVVITTNVAPVPRMKDILEVLDATPTFTTEMLELCTWVAEYYLCSLGEVLQAALPSGLTPQSVVRITLVHQPSAEELRVMQTQAPFRAKVLQTILEQKGEVRISYLQKLLHTDSVADQLDALMRLGIIDISTSVEGASSASTQKVIHIVPELAASEKDLQAAFDILDKRAPKQSLVLGTLYLHYMRGGTPRVLTDVCTELGVGTTVAEELVKRGYAVLEKIPVQKSLRGNGLRTLVQRNEAELLLTTEQQHAVDIIDTPTTYLLHGITGSGKTLVYIKLIQRIQAQGKSALLLVPEIALTPQLVDRFQAIFQNSIVVLHSKMTASERVAAFSIFSRKEPVVVIGARSAIFAPLENLGIIIVDEEHEASYKQENPSPRYHARDVAVMRAHMAGCICVLGSATPSIETLYNVRTHRYSYVALTHRADGAVSPIITIVDLKTEQKAQRLQGWLAQHTLQELQYTVRKKEGVLVFLNRRGFAPRQICNDCGNVPGCPNCDVKLTLHKATKTLKCHYCGYREGTGTICTVCGSLDISTSGAGTQQIEEDLLSVLQATGAVVARMDADSTAKRGEHRKLLQKFSDGAIDVLVGTQMIAKGLDIARVTLVIVVNADGSLFHTDFRSSERTLQLLTQVAGRAGRTAEKPGRVIIQTMNPTHPVLQAIQNNEQTAWYENELMVRSEALYPPFVRFITITISALEQSDVDHHAKILERLIPVQHSACIRLDATEPPIPKLKNNHRMVIVVKNFRSTDPSGAITRSILRNALTTYYKEFAKNSVRVTVNIDASGTL